MQDKITNLKSNGKASSAVAISPTSAALSACLSTLCDVFYLFVGSNPAISLCATVRDKYSIVAFAQAIRYGTLATDISAVMAGEGNSSLDLTLGHCHVGFRCRT